MKRYLFISLGIIFCTLNLKSQEMLKNGVEVFAGFGITESSHRGQSFSFNYQREISKKLYIDVGFEQYQGSQTLASLFGEVPSLDRSGEFGEIYKIENADLSSAPGRLIHQGSWSLGLKKYIKMTPVVLMGGGLSITTNSINEMDVEGLTFEQADEINYDNAYPVYSSYKSIGAKVSLEVLYFIKEGIAIASKAQYLSSSSVVSLSLGTCVTF